MKILVAIDGSPAALDALRHAMAFVRGGLQAQLLLVTVQPTTFVYETLAPSPVVLDRLTGAEGRSDVPRSGRAIPARDCLWRSGADTLASGQLVQLRSHHDGGPGPWLDQVLLSRLGLPGGFALEQCAGHDRPCDVRFRGSLMVDSCTAPKHAEPQRGRERDQTQRSVELLRP